MKLVPDIAWRTAGRDPRRLDTRLLPLLHAIRRHATLRAATAELGLSYRSAWDMLALEARELGTPLVVLERGRGARLAALGERLLAADEEARRTLEAGVEKLSVPVELARHVAARAALRVAASHDLLLAEFSAAGHAALDLSWRGSGESLAAYAQGEADLAGFHVLTGPGTGETAAPYRAMLDPRRDRLLRFALREQGLLLPHGNPKKIRSLAGVADRGLRFINRQRGSGTRLLVDRLLTQGGIAPERLRGYGDEEFTHVAVAAMIAAGRADAGVGVRAAATRFGLAFVPLNAERYWLAVRLRLLGTPRVERLTEALAGTALPRLARKLTGYDTRGAGEICTLDALVGEE